MRPVTFPALHRQPRRRPKAENSGCNAPRRCSGSALSTAGVYGCLSRQLLLPFASRTARTLCNATDSATPPRVTWTRSGRGRAASVRCDNYTGIKRGKRRADFRPPWGAPSGPAALQAKRRHGGCPPVIPPTPCAWGSLFNVPQRSLLFLPLPVGPPTEWSGGGQRRVADGESRTCPGSLQSPILQERIGQHPGGFVPGSVLDLCARVRLRHHGILRVVLCRQGRGCYCGGGVAEFIWGIHPLRLRRWRGVSHVCSMERSNPPVPISRSRSRPRRFLRS